MYVCVQLHEVYSLPSLSACPSTSFLAAYPNLQCLDSAAKDQLVMLEYLDGSGLHLNRLFILEQGGKAQRDKFVTCMKVLGLYAKSDSSNSSN